ncbi:MAG: hypothetical protein PHS02_01490 [Candidatus ainarchaeum sp.]|nr:hypothetical protein [Candidatus ainarchaeum sp.]
MEKKFKIISGAELGIIILAPVVIFVLVGLYVFFGGVTAKNDAIVIFGLTQTKLMGAAFSLLGVFAIVVGVRLANPGRYYWIGDDAISFGKSPSENRIPFSAIIKAEKINHDDAMRLLESAFYAFSQTGQNTVYFSGNDLVKYCPAYWRHTQRSSSHSSPQLGAKEIILLTRHTPDGETQHFLSPQNAEEFLRELKMHVRI